MGDVGWDTSLVLDATGNPVVGYYDFTNGNLKVLHCNDPNCTGSGESIESPDTVGNVGGGASLELDYLGNPVVSYFDGTNGNLKLLHCTDANCAPGGDSITSPDSTGDVAGNRTSLELDFINPFVAYTREVHPFIQVHLVRCNDENCADGDDPIDVDGTPFFSISSPSLEVTISGDYTYSFYDGDNDGFYLFNCAGTTCTGGRVYGVGYGGAAFNSLTLDAADHPVFAFSGQSYELKLMHCDDVACTGSNESLSTPVGAGLIRYPSVVLDASGYPVISYYAYPAGDLKLVRCNDQNCAGNNETISTIDSMGDVGEYNSLALDASGNPVVSYFDRTLGNLKIVHCGNPTCKGTAAGVGGIAGLPDVLGAKSNDGREQSSDRANVALAVGVAFALALAAAGLYKCTRAARRE